MKRKLLFLAPLALALMSVGCHHSSSSSSSPAGFVSTVSSLASNPSETTEPVAVDGSSADASETTEPVPVS